MTPKRDELDRRGPPLVLEQILVIRYATKGEPEGATVGDDLPSTEAFFGAAALLFAPPCDHCPNR